MAKRYDAMLCGYWSESHGHTRFESDETIALRPGMDFLDPDPDRAWAYIQSLVRDVRIEQTVVPLREPTWGDRLRRRVAHTWASRWIREGFSATNYEGRRFSWRFFFPPRD